MDVLTETDLQGLIGESESMVLEFKGPEDFLAWPKTKPKIAESLSKVVSALANTYGGQIIIGLQETQDTPRRAKSIAGVDPHHPSLETIQRIIESNVQPRLEGIRYRAITLTGVNSGLVAYAITVPQGLTAYQANDKRYYGRSEYESTALDDQLIRYKMLRERAAEATINVTDLDLETAATEYQRRQERLKNLRNDRDEDGFVFVPPAVREPLEAPLRDFDEYSFSISIRNTGTITIHDCLLKIEISDLPNAMFTPTGTPRDGSGYNWHLRLDAQNRVRTLRVHDNETQISSRAKVFPTEEQLFPGAKFIFKVPTDTDIQNAILNWTLYLEDSPPLSGSIPLGEKLKSQSLV